MDINFLNEKEKKGEKAKDKKSEPVKNNPQIKADKSFLNFFNFKKDEVLMPKNLEKKRKSTLKDIKTAKNNQAKSGVFSAIKNIKKALFDKNFPKIKKTKQDFYKTKVEEVKIDSNNKRTENQASDPVESDDKKWEKINTVNTNLIKDETYIYFDWQLNIIYLIIGILISSIILSAAYFSLSYIKETKNITQMEYTKTEYTKEISELKTKMAEAKKEIEKIKVFSVKMKMVKEILDQHVYWNNMFAFLEKNTLPNVYYSGFSGDTSGTYNLSAKTSDFNDLYTQILQFKNNPEVLEVKTEKGERFTDPDTNKSKVGFGLNIKIDPNIFYQ